MLRTIIFALLLATLSSMPATASPAGAEIQGAAADVHGGEVASLFDEIMAQLGLDVATGTQIQFAQGCCRICRTGKACGNSCISVRNTCRTRGGCACNG